MDKYNSKTEYITTAEAAAKWGISDRRVRTLCVSGRIAGAVKDGKSYLIPANAMKPSDNREKAKAASDMSFNTVTQATLQETMKFHDFKKAGVKGINECKVRSVILPLLADHVLREANHYIRLLKEFE